MATNPSNPTFDDTNGKAWGTSQNKPLPVTLFGASSGDSDSSGPLGGDSGVSMQETNPLSQQYVNETVALTNVANATPEFVYIDMDGFVGCVVHVEKSGGTDTFDVDYESSAEGSDASDDWVDTTTSWTLVGGTAAADQIAIPTNVNLSPRGHRVEITTAGGSDDADFNVFIKKFYT